MKTESTVKFVARLALALLIITSVVAVCLAGVNEITAPQIAAENAKKTQEAVAAVLDGGGEPMAEGTYTPDSNHWVTNVYKSDKGYAVEVTPTTGFSGEITMMVGIDLDGNVHKIAIVSHSETAGLGAVAADGGEKGTNFRGQFEGLSGSVGVTKDNGTIEAISGATITSRAVCDGVNAALECVAQMG